MNLDCKSSGMAEKLLINYLNFQVIIKGYFKLLTELNSVVGVMYKISKQTVVRVIAVGMGKMISSQTYSLTYQLFTKFLACISLILSPVFLPINNILIITLALTPYNKMHYKNYSNH